MSSRFGLFVLFNFEVSFFFFCFCVLSANYLNFRYYTNSIGKFAVRHYSTDIRHYTVGAELVGKNAYALERMYTRSVIWSFIRFKMTTSSIPPKTRTT